MHCKPFNMNKANLRFNYVRTRLLTACKNYKWHQFIAAMIDYTTKLIFSYLSYFITWHSIVCCRPYTISSTFLKRSFWNKERKWTMTNAIASLMHSVNGARGFIKTTRGNIAIESPIHPEGSHSFIRTRHNIIAYITRNIGLFYCWRQIHYLSDYTSLQRMTVRVSLYSCNMRALYHGWHNTITISCLKADCSTDGCNVEFGNNGTKKKSKSTKIGY